MSGGCTGSGDDLVGKDHKFLYEAMGGRVSALLPKLHLDLLSYVQDVILVPCQRFEAQTVRTADRSCTKENYYRG